MMMRWAVALAAALAAGCVTEIPMGRLHFHEARVSDGRPATYLGMPLRTGQIVLSEAPGAYSLLFSLGPERHYDFTHAAVLVMEDGAPWVYEMTGEYKLGLGDRPTDGIEGTCRKIKLVDYAMAYLYVEVFDPPPGVDGAKVGAWAQAQLERQTPFDATFDYDEHERLFCTEFVQLALEAGGAPPAELVAVRQQPSLLKLLTWFGVTTQRCLPAGTLVDPSRSVASMGLAPTTTSMAFYFQAKAELHRRFTNDQRLGNLFEMQGVADIEMRPTVYQFLQRASRLRMGQRTPPPPDVVHAEVQALAEELLGVEDR